MVKRESMDILRKTPEIMEGERAVPNYFQSKLELELLKNKSTTPERRMKREKA